MTLTAGMSLTAIATSCMKPEETDHLCNLRNHVTPICPQAVSSLEEDSDQHACFNNERVSYYSDMMKGTSFPAEDNSYSASFHPLCNEWVAFWLFLVASSYFLLSRNVYSFRNYRIKQHAEKKVTSPDRTSPTTPARIENGEETAFNSMFSFSERSLPSHTISSKCDTLSDISDFDRTSYLDSLLSLEEEDSEWLSDSKPYGCSNQKPSTPISYKCDSFSEISDLDSPSYWDSLLKLDSEWISDSKQELHHVQYSFHSPSYRRCNWGVEALPLVSTTCSLTGVYSDRSEDNSISVENLLETTDIDEFGADEEPLFWPFEGELSWDSADSWSSFCSSPRKRFVFDSRPTTSMMEECGEKGDDEAACSAVKSETSMSSMLSKRSSAKVVPLECADQLSLSKILFNEDYAPSNDLLLEREYFALDQELPIETLMGLKEFDGHEGLGSGFNGDVFMLDEFYSTT